MINTIPRSSFLWGVKQITRTGRRTKVKGNHWWCCSSVLLWHVALSLRSKHVYIHTWCVYIHDDFPGWHINFRVQKLRNDLIQTPNFTCAKITSKLQRDLPTQALLIWSLIKRTTCSLFGHVSSLPNVGFLSSSVLLQVAGAHSLSLLYNDTVWKIRHIFVIHYPVSGDLPHFLVVCVCQTVLLGTFLYIAPQCILRGPWHMCS